MSRWFLLLAVIPLAVIPILVGGDEVDERVSARPGGELKVDVVLGSGLAFDKGSLQVTSHESEDEVHVRVETSGWGRYAVDVDIDETPSGVRVDVKVDGLLHWLFGGPTVDVRLGIPPEYAVEAHIDGGPLQIEDVTGAVVAGVAGGEGTLRPVTLGLRRVEGRVRLATDDHAIEAEDVTGSLEIETAGGAVEIAGVRGSVRITSAGGSVALDDVEGDVRIETTRGRIEVEDVRGEVFARSERGGIDVEFLGAPAGVLETGRGSVHVSVPRGAPFALDASTARGDIDVDSDLALVAAVGEGERSLALGREIAGDVERTVKRFVRRGLDTGDWTWEEPPEWGRWRDRDWGWKGHGDFDGFEGFGFRRARHVAGNVGLGGSPLRIRTGRGSIEISER